MLPRRAFLQALAAAVTPDRLGIMCILGAEEAAARRVLAAAAQAGFRRVQIMFPWTKVSAEYLRTLPGWLKSEGLSADVLSAYVNCCAPENILMECRAEDFDRAVDYAATLGCRHLIAWTGGYGAGLMKSDPRNFEPAASAAIARFLEKRVPGLEKNRLTLALETYITLACPDAPSLRKLLDRLPSRVTAVLDPPNLTPVAQYNQRDKALDDMVRTLAGRVGVVHLKDFRLRPDGASYDLPGPLDGEMNYSLYLKHVQGLPASVPVIAEHLQPAQFATARRRLLERLGRPEA